ncbi:MAG: hypothetical protein EBE86_021470 [Hormoscilla sp. GUM202]|nr:hypothetical protein [Hormoscilla sp. GUM202]
MVEDEFNIAVLSWSPNRVEFEGGDGNDMKYGGLKNDFLNGKGGNDTLLGGSGDDWLLGKSGDDLLNPGPGNDQIVGGDGSDTYVLAPNMGRNYIYDFNRRDKDRIQLEGGLSFDDLTIVRTGNETNIFRGSVRLATVRTTNVLNSGDFVQVESGLDISVESGLDISMVNTIKIEDTQGF